MTRIVCEYGVSIVPFGRPIVVISSEMKSGTVWRPGRPDASVTVSLTLNRPVATGVPQSSTCVGLTLELATPLPQRISTPGGRPSAVHVNGAEPPVVTLKRLLSGTPIVPFG